MYTTNMKKKYIHTLELRKECGPYCTKCTIRVIFEKYNTIPQYDAINSY